MNSKVEETIIQTIIEEKPETISQLVALLEAKLGMNSSEIMDICVRLKREDKSGVWDHFIVFEGKQKLPMLVKSKVAYWYWITMSLVLATLVASAIIQDQMPFVIIRIVLGFVFVLVMPGYCLVRVLFPNRVIEFNKTGGIDLVTSFSLAIVLSIAVVSLVGLVLDYTPWGINLGTLLFSLSLLTAFFATIAILKENQNINDLADNLNRKSV